MSTLCLSSSSSLCSCSCSSSSSSSTFFIPNPVIPPAVQGVCSRSSSTVIITCSTSYRNSSLSRYGSSNPSPFQNTTVSVFWDLDNKPPKNSPYHAAISLRHAASQFGSVVDMVAYANRHAFIHVPQWVREQRQERRELDRLEQVGVVKPLEPYVCRLCGRRCRTNILLKRHFKQLHEREQNKRMARLSQLKGKKKVKFRQSIQPRSERYKEAARPLFAPKTGYGLESDLRRAGVYVRTVEDKPQAADIALRKQMEDSMNKGIKCICLVSDDSDFLDMLRAARAQDLRTVVFGESNSLRRYADFWFHWDDISHGIPQNQIDEVISRWASKPRQDSLPFHEASISGFGGLANDPANLGVQHKIFTSNPIAKTRFSAFSEEEAQVFGLSDEEWSSDGDGDDYDEGDDSPWDVDAIS